MERRIYEYKDRLYRLCMYLEKDTDKADELFQETWVKAIEKIDMYQENKPFYPWLTQIAVNLYRDRLRFFKREFKRRLWVYEETIESYSTYELPIDKKIIEKEQLQMVKDKIAQLPEKYRLPLVLVLVEKISYKDVGILLEMEEKLVKSRVYDARQKLKKQLQQEGEGFYE